MKWDELSNQRCSVARSLAVVGDRWTLLILRECFNGVRRFDHFQSRLGISRTIVSDRLALLVREGVLDRVDYEERPPRAEYRLTPKGRDLHPVLMSLFTWGDTHYSGDAGPPLLFRHKTCGQDFTPVTCCSECGDALRPGDVEVRPGPGASQDHRDQHGGGRSDS